MYLYACQVVLISSKELESSRDVRVTGARISYDPVMGKVIVSAAVVVAHSVMNCPVATERQARKLVLSCDTMTSWGANHRGERCKLR